MWLMPVAWAIILDGEPAALELERYAGKVDAEIHRGAASGPWRHHTTILTMQLGNDIKDRTGRIHVHCAGSTHVKTRRMMTPLRKWRSSLI
jgi:hypothetical protein